MARLHRLGAGPISVAVMHRGGIGQVATIPSVTEGKFTRVLDKTSTASIRIPIGSAGFEQCCREFESIRKWRHELTVSWANKVAWTGPIVNMVWSRGYVDLQAADLSAWWGRRRLSAVSHVDEDLTEIFLDYHAAALQPDSSMNMSVMPTPSGRSGTRHVFESDNEYVADGIAELARTGLDYTVIKRTVLVGPTLGDKVSFQLSDAAFVKGPDIVEAGDIQANSVRIRAGGDDGQGVGSYLYGTAEDATAIESDGLLERIFDEPSIFDQASADAAAASRLALLRESVYLDINGDNALKPTAPITLDKLIPGRLVRVESNSSCRTVSGVFRLKAVEVKFDGSVGINLQPVGTL